MSNLKTILEEYADEVSFFATDTIARGLADKTLPESKAHELYKNKVQELITETLAKIEGMIPEKLDKKSAERMFGRTSRLTFFRKGFNHATDKFKANMKGKDNA